MTVLHDMFFKPTPGEISLREELDKATAKAEALEDALLTPDQEEFTNPVRHVEICFERQKAAHAHRKAAALQSRLNGAENRRYSRSILIWMLIANGVMFFKEGMPLTVLVEFVKALAGG